MEKRCRIRNPLGDEVVGTIPEQRAGRLPSPIPRLNRVGAFVVQGRPLVRAGETIEALPPHRLQVKEGRILSAEPVAPSRGASSATSTFLMPGLADPHLHLVGMASARLHGADVVTTGTSLDDFLAGVAELANKSAEDWVRLEGFEESEFEEGRLPSLAELDAACPDRPLRVRHASRHASLLNSAGRQWLREHGWSSGFDEQALLVGCEIELGHFLPRLAPELLRKALSEVGELLLQCGVTSVDDVTPSNDPERLALLEAADLPQAIRFWLGVDADWQEARCRSSRVSIAGVKLLPRDAKAVGSSWFREGVVAARREGFPLAIHAVEPDAIAAVLDVLAAAPARAAGGPAGLDRIEHASLCPPALVEALADAGVAVVTQPAFLSCRGARYRRQLERPLWPWLYPVASLDRAGVPLAFSSDAPVASPGLAPTLAAASGRGRGSLADFGEAESVSPGFVFAAQCRTHRKIRGEALAAPWFAPGSEADFLVLDGDPRPTDFADLQVTGVVLPDSKVAS